MSPITTGNQIMIVCIESPPHFKCINMQMSYSYYHYISFLGKDGSVWRKHLPSRKTVRLRKQNLIKRLPGCISETKALNKILDIFNYFINDGMVQLIVDSRNAFINSVRSNYARSRESVILFMLQNTCALNIICYENIESNITGYERPVRPIESHVKCDQRKVKNGYILLT